MRLCAACIVNIKGREIYIAPNGRAMDGSRIGESRGGRLIQTPDLSDGEIEDLGLTGQVLPGTAEANLLYDK